MVCRFYPGSKLNTTLNTLSCNVFFFLSSQISTYFKNLNSLTLCQLLLVYFGRKMQVYIRGSLSFFTVFLFRARENELARLECKNTLIHFNLNLRLEDQHRKIFNYYSPQAKLMLIEASVVYLRCSLPC